MNTMIKDLKRGHMSAVVMSLLQANNTITTLEVKQELRTKHPDFSWKQTDVSNYMNAMHLSGDLTYEDNGTFRTYSGESLKKTSVKKDAKGKNLKKVAAKSISRAKAYDLMTGNKGYFFTAEFVKKDGKTRIINCQASKDQKDSKLGYINVKEASLMRTDPDNAYRKINMQTIKSLKIGGVAYKIK